MGNGYDSDNIRRTDLIPPQVSGGYGHTVDLIRRGAGVGRKGSRIRPAILHTAEAGHCLCSAKKGGAPGGHIHFHTGAIHTGRIGDVHLNSRRPSRCRQRCWRGGDARSHSGYGRWCVVNIATAIATTGGTEYEQGGSHEKQATRKRQENGYDVLQSGSSSRYNIGGRRLRENSRYQGHIPRIENSVSPRL